MGVHAQQKFNQLLTGSPPGAVTALSGAAPQTGAGGKVVMSKVQLGSLSAKVIPKATTNTLTITGKWQVSDNGTTWYDAALANNAANVILVTGTGSAVTVTRQIDAPPVVYGSRYARFVVVTGVASAGSGDEYTIGYSWRMRAPIEVGSATIPTAAALSGTAGTVVAGSAIDAAQAALGTPFAHVYAKAGTSSLVLTGKWQVSADGSTWFDCALANNAAYVAVATATAEVTLRVSAPPSVFGQRYFRYAIVTSGATAVGGTTDMYGIGYGYARSSRSEMMW